MVQLLESILFRVLFTHMRIARVFTEFGWMWELNEGVKRVFIRIWQSSFWRTQSIRSPAGLRYG